ncbi:hypothetical protein D9M72_321730 [compost metagenome]
MRVWALNGTNSGFMLAITGAVSPGSWRASVMMLRPSGVSSASDDSHAASASCSCDTPGAGMKRDA